MSGKFLLDTNIVIALFANEETVVKAIANTDEVFIPSIVLGELYYGAQNSQKKDANQAIIDDFAKQNVVLNCNREPARWHGYVKGILKTKGRPIPENDIWIAAISIQYGLTLISRDKHFHEIEDLKIASW